MRKVKKTDAINTFLGSGTSVDGTIEFNGTIRLDGNVKGEVFSSEGTVIVGENAVINADLKVGIAILKGKVHGCIDAKKRIEVYPPAQIMGDIQAPVILIKAGVVLKGNCITNASEISSDKVPVGTENIDITEQKIKIKNFPKTL